MNTYKDPEYRGYYLGKVAVALVLLIIVVVAASRYPGATTAPAEAPMTPVAESAQLTPGGSEATTSPAADASGASAIATGAPEAAQAAATGATPAAVPAVESAAPIATATAPAGVTTAASEAVQAPETSAAEKNVAVSGMVNAPTTAAGSSSLAAFSTTMGAPSDYQPYTVSGGHLTAKFNIMAPRDLEISTDAATVPTISVSTSSLSDFSTMVGAPSTAQTYRVSGSHLTGDIRIVAPAGFEISKDDSAYSASMTLAQSGGTVTTTTVFVRLTGAAEGSYAGNISHTSTGPLATAAPGASQAAGEVAIATPGTAQAKDAAAFATATPGEPMSAVPAPAQRAPGAPTAVVPAAATEGVESTGPALAISRVVVDDKTGQVTLIGIGRPYAPIEVVRDETVITGVVVESDGTWKYTYLTTPGVEVVAVQYKGQPRSRTPSLRFDSTGMLTATPTPILAVGSSTNTGQSYIVQYGDYLRGLALRFYGDELQWPLIYDGTNAMAARDASFAVIDDPNLIEPGWKLWIPAE